MEPDVRSLGRRWASFLISRVRAILLKFIWAKSSVVGHLDLPTGSAARLFFTRTNVSIEICTEHAIWNVFHNLLLSLHIPSCKTGSYIRVPYEFRTSFQEMDLLASQPKLARIVNF